MAKWFLTLVVIWGGVVNSQVPPQTTADELLDRLTVEDTASGLLSLVSFVATPGIRGIDFTVDDEFSGTDVEYSKTNLAVAKNFGDFELWRSKFSIYTSLGFGALNQKNAFPVTTLEGQPLLLDFDRDLNSGWLGLGLNFRLPHHLRFKPYVTAAYSRFDTQTTVFGGSFDPDDLTPVQRVAVLDTKAKAWTVTPTLNLKYDRWLQAGRLELEGIYSYSYSETFDASDPLFEVSGGTDLITAFASWTAPTGKSLFDTPLYWSVFGGYTDFISLSRFPLGFNDFFEFGASLEFRLNRKILGFDLNFVGLEFSALVGEDLRGWTWAIVLRD